MFSLVREMAKRCVNSFTYGVQRHKTFVGQESNDMTPVVWVGVDWLIKLHTSVIA